MQNNSKKKKNGRQGEGGGRKPKYATEKSITEKILEYLEECEIKRELPNKAGLRIKLDIDKSTYSDYKKKFPNPIKRAEAIIENAWVQRLKDPAATGAIFYLKNAFYEDYKDKHETDITSGGEKIVTITGMKIIKDADTRDTIQEQKQ